MKLQRFIAGATGASILASSLVLPVFAKGNNDEPRMIGSSTPSSGLQLKDRDQNQDRIGDRTKPADNDKKMNKERRDIYDRYERAMNDLEKMATRTEQMILQFKEKGADVSSSTALMEIAKTKIATAKTALSTFENVLATATSTVSASSSTSIKATVREQIKAESKKVDVAMKEAKKALTEVTRSLDMGFWNRVMNFFKEKPGEGIHATGTASGTPPFASSTKEMGKAPFWKWFNPGNWFRK